MNPPPVGDPWVKSAQVSATEGDTSDSRGTDTRPPGLTKATWGGLEILQEIGQGGFGRVYRAWEPTLAREVALKIICPPEGQPAAVNAILREGQLLARVHHRNVVTIHGAQQIGNEIGLWMEFVRGRTLTDIVRHDGPRAAGEAALIGVTLCQAVAAVHQTGIVHRDIKAHNVMREAGGRIVLMDFGAGQVLTDPRSDSHPVGTPVYMAPEVLAGSRATARSDMYSLGVLLYYLVTGAYPVEGRTWTDFLIAHARSDRRHLADVRPDLPARFVHVVERATLANPDERYATPGAMLRELADAATAEESTTTGRPTTRIDASAHVTTEPWMSSHVWRIAGAVTAVVIGIGVLGTITTAVYNNTLGRSGDFASEPFLARWTWGLKSLVSGSVQIAVVLMMLWLVRSIWNLLARLLPSVSRLTSRMRLYAAIFTHRMGLNDPTTAAHALLTAQIVALFGFCWYFGDIISSVSTLLEHASPQAIEALRPVHLQRHQNFNLTMAMIVLGMSCGARQVMKLRQAAGRSASRGPLFAIFGVIACALVLVVSPYRLIWHNRAEVVNYQSLNCYAIGERQADVLVYCPSAAIPKVRVISRADPHLQRSRVIESIYTR